MYASIVTEKCKREMLCKEKASRKPNFTFSKMIKHTILHTRMNCKKKLQQAYINVYVVKLSSIILTKKKKQMKLLKSA